MIAERIVPNFLIASVPKCGTTALSEYLRAHQNILMSFPKEPHFFATGLEALRVAKSIEEYLALFEAQAKGHIAVGEVSA